MTPSEEEIKKATDQVEFRVNMISKIDSLNATIASLDKSFTQFNQGMGKRIDEIEKVLMQHSIIMPDLKCGIEDYRDSKKWISRIVVGSVITALLGLVILKK